MQTKQYRRCRKEKLLFEFQKYWRNKDGLQPYCRDCKKMIDREQYQKNPHRNYQRNKINTNRNRLWLYEYLKTRRCELKDCPIADPDALVFNRLNPSEKRLEAGRMAGSSCSLKTVQAEAAKRRVLCANQKKHTIQQFGYKRWLQESLTKA